jgi:hypothetical protein
VSDGLAPVAVALIPRATPLPVAAAAAAGPVARALARRLLQEDDRTLAQLEGVRTRKCDVMVVRGPAELLPWVEGVCWLGEVTPGLFVPTTQTFSAPDALVRAALQHELPLAFFHGETGPQRIALATALALSREVLALVAG